MRIAWKSLFALAVALELGAQQPVTVLGAVRDSATSRPLSGAIVQMVGGSRSLSIRSDEIGEFSFLSVETGPYKVVVRRIGYGQFTADVQIAPDQRTIEVRMVPIPQTLKRVTVRGEGTGVYGEVASLADLKPVPGARIQVAGSRQTVTTDSVGSFFIPLKGPGSYVVRITAPGYANEFFTVPVRRNEVADASRLLSSGEDRLTIPEGLWKDFDQRLSWRSPNHSALASGSEVRKAGASVQDAIQFLGPVVAKSMRLGSSVCVYVDGNPRPGFPLNSIRPEEVKAIELYGRDKQVASMLRMMWPGGPCSETGVTQPRRGSNGITNDAITYIVIWTR